MKIEDSKATTAKSSMSVLRKFHCRLMVPKIKMVRHDLLLSILVQEIFVLNDYLFFVRLDIHVKLE